MKTMNKKSLSYIIAAIALVAVFVIYAVTNGGNGANETFWSLVPPIVAIALALITKRGLLFTIYRYCNWCTSLHRP